MLYQYINGIWCKYDLKHIWWDVMKQEHDKAITGVHISEYKQNVAFIVAYHLS